MVLVKTKQRKVTPRSRTVLMSSAMFVYHTSSWETAFEAPQHKSQTTVSRTTPHAPLSHSTSPCSRNQGKGKLYPGSLLTSLAWISCFYSFLDPCSVSLILSSSDAACFDQSLSHLTNGPAVTWELLLPLVKTPTSSSSHCHSSQHHTGSSSNNKKATGLENRQNWFLWTRLGLLLPSANGSHS